MSIAHSRPFRRQDAPSFDSTMYYTLNNLVLPKFTLSAGISGGGTNALINVTTYSDYSSENWQLFSQSGHYFIRNFDYGAKWQLGLTEGDKNIPKLYPRSGGIAQQWTLNKVDGGWEIGNGLLGPGVLLAMPNGWSVPSMRSGNDGTVWNITSNPSAAKVSPLAGDSINNVANFETATPSPTPTPSASSASATTNGQLTDLPTISISPTTSDLSSPNPSFASQTSPASALSSGAIAGIAIGAIGLVGVAIFILWFCLFRKKKPAYHQHGAPHEVSGTPIISEKYAYNVAELATPPVEIMTKDNETVHNRAELSSTFGTFAENQPLRREGHRM